jgi:hypothetical protein
VTLVARKRNKAIVEPIVGSDAVCFWRHSGVRWSVDEFGINLASVPVKMFLHNLLYIQIINVILSW